MGTQLADCCQSASADFIIGRGLDSPWNYNAVIELNFS